MNTKFQHKTLRLYLWGWGESDGGWEVTTVKHTRVGWKIILDDLFKHLCHCLWRKDKSDNIILWTYCCFTSLAPYTFAKWQWTKFLHPIRLINTLNIHTTLTIHLHHSFNLTPYTLFITIIISPLHKHIRHFKLYLSGELAFRDHNVTLSIKFYQPLVNRSRGLSRNTALVRKWN